MIATETYYQESSYIEMSVNAIEYEIHTQYECRYCHTTTLNTLFHQQCPKKGRTTTYDFISSPVTYVYLFGRDDDRTRRQVIVNDFIPHFYVNKSDKALRIKQRELYANGVLSLLKTDNYFGLFGEELVTVMCNTPKQVVGTKWEKGLKSMFENTFEADVKFRTRFLISKHILEGIRFTDSFTSHINVQPISFPSYLRTLYLDIETFSRVNVPHWEHPNDPIIIVGYCDSYEEKYYSFAWHPKFKKQIIDTTYIKRVQSDRETAPWRIFIGSNEREMMELFVENFREIDPDAVTGWNIQSFDLPYLKARGEKLDVNINSISPMNRVSILKEEDKKKTSVKIWGRVIIDELAAYLELQTHDLDSYRLDKVSDYQLGVGKVALNQSVGEVWANNFKKALIYNAADIELCYEIDQKLQIMNFLDGERRFTGCEFEDVLMRSRVIDVTLLREAQDLHFALPTKPTDQLHFTFIGGMVFDSKPGKYRNVVVVDFTAFYPSIMIALNASKECRLTDEKLIAKLEKLHQFYPLLSLFIGKFPKMPYTRSMKGIWFDNTRDSLVRRVIGKFIDRRKEIKWLMRQHKAVGKCSVCSSVKECNSKWRNYNELQKAYKTRINAYYGVSGYKGFRLHDLPTVKSQPAVARDFLEFTAKIVKSRRLYRFIQDQFPSYNITTPPEIIYGDTDSIFIKLDEKLTVSQGIEVAKFITEYLNKAFFRLVSRYYFHKQHFNIEMGVDRFFDPLFFFRTKLHSGKKKQTRGAKKRYAGRERWADGKFIDHIVKKGVETVRSDAPLISKNAQERCIDLLCHDVEIDVILKGITTIISRMRKGYYPLEEIAIPTGIRVDLNNYALDQKGLPMHIRATLNSAQYWEWEPRNAKILYCFFKQGVVEWSGTSTGKKYTKIIYGKTDVFAFQYESDIPPEFKEYIDMETMIEKTMKSELETIIEIGGVQWDQFFHNQQSLNKWMK